MWKVPSKLLSIEGPKTRCTRCREVTMMAFPVDRKVRRKAQKGCRPCGQQNAVFGQEMQGVIHCDAKGDGEDDGGGDLQVDVHGPHDASDEDQGEEVGDQSDDEHAQAPCIRPISRATTAKAISSPVTMSEAQNRVGCSGR